MYQGTSQEDNSGNGHGKRGGEEKDCQEKMRIKQRQGSALKWKLTRPNIKNENIHVWVSNLYSIYRLSKLTRG